MIDYPYDIATKNQKIYIVVGLFKITNNKTEELIHQVEMDAGYIFANVEITKQKFDIYLFSEAEPNESG